MSTARTEREDALEREVPRPAQRTQPIDVLIVDDDESSRLGLASAVASFGYPVRVASSGDEALVEMARHPAAIVLTDWSMPGMTGLELCLALKRLEPQPHVVLMTGFDGRSRLLEALRAGADEFIAKPIDVEELEVRLLAVTRTVNAERMLRRRNVTLRHESEREFRIARTDALTAIPNRRRMDEDLARAIGDALRYRHRHCIAICDIDFFKRYNDRNGHLAGDVALQRVAAALREGVRTSDTVYRFGGEEFLILLPQQTLSEAAVAVERIRRSVQALSIENAPVSACGMLTISAGIAEWKGDTKEEWLLRADAALYRAKAEGRNRVAGSES